MDWVFFLSKTLSDLFFHPWVFSLSQTLAHLFSLKRAGENTRLYFWLFNYAGKIFTKYGWSI